FVHAKAVHAGPTKGGKWAGVHVHYPSTVVREHARWHETQISGERDQLDVVASEDAHEIVFRTRIEHQRLDSGSACSIERASAGPVGRDDHHFTTCRVTQRCKV